MAKVVDIDIQDSSLDSSADGEFLGMVDEGSFEAADDKNLVAHSILETSGEFRDIAGGVTYRLVPMTSGEEAGPNQTAGSPTHILPGGEYYVISNPVEVFGQSPAPKKPIRRDTLQAKAMTTKKRDDRRRATHNEVERRRRDKINSWITKLAALIPTSGLPDTASKGGILAKACDHITELSKKVKRFEKMEMENEKLEANVYKLNKEIAELKRENTVLRGQISLHPDSIIKQRPKSEC